MAGSWRFHVINGPCQFNISPLMNLPALLAYDMIHGAMWQAGISSQVYLFLLHIIIRPLISQTLFCFEVCFKRGLSPPLYRNVTKVQQLSIVLYDVNYLLVI